MIMRPLRRLAILAERPHICAARLQAAGMDAEIACEVAFYLAQANDLAALEEPLQRQLAADGIACRVFDPAQGSTMHVEWLAWLGQDPQAAMVWNVTDGIAYFLGSSVPATARLAGIPNFGSPAACQALVQDKFMTGAVLAHAGLPVPPTALASGERWLSDPPRFDPPYFVKPATLGAKLGIWPESRCADVCEALALSVRIHERYGDRAIVQPYIDGWDLRVSYLATGPDPELAGLGVHGVSSDGGEGFMTLAASHAAIECGRVQIQRIEHSEIAALSRRAAALLDLRDVFSLDWRVDVQGKPWLLEAEVCPAVTIYDFIAYVREVHGMSLVEALSAAITYSWSARASISAIR